MSKSPRFFVAKCLDCGTKQHVDVMWLSRRTRNRCKTCGSLSLIPSDEGAERIAGFKDASREDAENIEREMNK